MTKVRNTGFQPSASGRNTTVIGDLRKSLSTQMLLRWRHPQNRSVTMPAVRKAAIETYRRSDASLSYRWPLYESGWMSGLRPIRNVNRTRHGRSRDARGPSWRAAKHRSGARVCWARHDRRDHQHTFLLCWLSFSVRPAMTRTGLMPGRPVRFLTNKAFPNYSDALIVDRQSY